jgi:hypothetical protein
LGCTLNKKKVKKSSKEGITISDNCMTLINQNKPPFETPDEYINRLMSLHHKHNQLIGKEFINMIFHDKFLMCTQNYFKKCNSKSKKEKIVESNRQRIKNKIQEIFNSNDDIILLLLILIDEGVSLLFQTDYYDMLSNYKELEFEESIEEAECVSTID